MITVINRGAIGAEQVCELLHAIHRRCRKPVTIVLDNASYHRARIVHNLAAALNIELLFLPPYSPNLNLIERVWKLVKKLALTPVPSPTSKRSPSPSRTPSNAWKQIIANNYSPCSRRTFKTLTMLSFQPFEVYYRCHFKSLFCAKDNSIMSTLISILKRTIAVLVAAACAVTWTRTSRAADAPKNAETAAAATTDEAPANTLSIDEQQAGWKLLFDGKSLDGWHTFKSKEIRPGWQIKDGALTCADPKNAGDLCTNDQYDWFELQLDYNISHAGNSGIMYHVTDKGAPPGRPDPNSNSRTTNRPPTPFAAAGSMRSINPPSIP